MLLINDLVQMRTKKDLKCLTMSFAFLVSVAFQKCLLLPLVEEYCFNVSFHSMFCL